MTIAFTLALTIPAGYALARFPIPGKEGIFVFLLLALIIPYQALLTPMFLMFAQRKLTNTLVGPGHPPHRDPAALQPVHHAQQLRGGPARARGSRADRRRQLVADPPRIFLPAVVPAIVTVALFAFVTSWNEFLGALVLLSRARRSRCR